MPIHEPPQHINALCEHGPINGGSIAFAVPQVNVIDGELGIVQDAVTAATFVLVVDGVHHLYVLALRDFHPYQYWRYDGVAEMLAPNTLAIDS